MGVGVCYISVTNGIKHKQQKLSWEDECFSTSTQRFRNLWLTNVPYNIHNIPPLVPIQSHKNPPQPSPLKCITLYLPITTVFPTGLPSSRSQTKSHNAFLSVSTEIALLKVVWHPNDTCTYGRASVKYLVKLEWGNKGDALSQLLSKSAIKWANSKG
jgi:hypothetical protein